MDSMGENLHGGTDVPSIRDLLASAEIDDHYRELLSTETSDLVSELMEEYATGRRSRSSESISSASSCGGVPVRVRKPPGREPVSSDEESSASMPTDSSDEDYIPMRRRRRRRGGGTVRGRSRYKGVIARGRGAMRRSKLTWEEQKKGYKCRRLPEEMRCLFGQASVCYLQGKVDEAIEMCQEVIRRIPGHCGAYDLMASMYSDKGDAVKSFEYTLLSASLNRNMDSDQWQQLAKTAVSLNRPEQALVCYQRALKLDPQNVSLHSTIIELNASVGLTKGILPAQLTAIKELLCCEELTTEKYLEMCSSVYESCVAERRRSGELTCLRCYIIRAKAAGIDCDDKVEVYINKLNEDRRFLDLFVAICNFTSVELIANDQRLEVDAKYVNTLIVEEIKFADNFPMPFLCKAVVSSIYVKNVSLSKLFVDVFKGVQPLADGESYYEDILVALMYVGRFSDAVQLVESLLPLSPLHTENVNQANILVKYADALLALDMTERAMRVLEHVIVSLKPDHALARLNLAALQQKLGLFENAMRTLDLFDSAGVQNLGALDERLLHAQCTILAKRQMWAQYIMSGTHLLAMYFKDVYSSSCFSRLRNYLPKRSSSVRSIVMYMLRGSDLEKLVRRVPHVRSKALTPRQLWEVFDKLCHLYVAEKRYQELLQLCLYGSQSVMLARSGYLWKVDGALVLAGCLFLMKPEINLHRFALRAASKFPESISLAYLNGNHSLVAGSLHHALVEYFFVLQQDPSSPLTYLLIAVTFINLATRRGILRKNDCAIQGLAFLAKYEELRGSCAEVYYNIGRAMEQLGLLNVSVYYYERVLSMEPDVQSPSSEAFDLRFMSAHNLVCLYKSSSNVAAAMDLMEKYMVV